MKLWWLVCLIVPVCVQAESGLKDVKTNRDDLVWTDIRNLEVEGRGWQDTKEYFDRLPARAEKLVRPPVWSLSRHSAGILVRFVTSSPRIDARWVLTSANLAMPHMAATGVSGLDLYVRIADRKWRWLAVGIPKEQTNSVQLAAGLPSGEREYLLYLPLYNGVRSVEIGLLPGQAIRPAGPWGGGIRKPILFYGTSILQGGCASRPGMVHTAILGRRFDWPTINLGFSGNGRMEPELADLLAELDPAVYVLDCLPNMTPENTAERVEPFVRRLRQSRPETPVVLVEDRAFANAFLLADKQRRHSDNHRELRAAFDRLRKSGLRKIYYLKGDLLFGEDGEGTVDGSHPTDLGFTRQADALAAVLKPLLKP